MNTGATAVEVDGTRVKAEARAVALGHDVEAVVVARLVLKEGAAPTVETYERWSVVDTERGIREHVAVEVDLLRRGTTPPPADVPPGEITPSEK